MSPLSSFEPVLALQFYKGLDCHLFSQVETVVGPCLTNKELFFPLFLEFLKSQFTNDYIFVSISYKNERRSKHHTGMSSEESEALSDPAADTRDQIWDLKSGHECFTIYLSFFFFFFFFGLCFVVLSKKLCTYVYLKCLRSV